MGLIDASKPRSYAPRKGLLAPVLDQTTTTGSMESQSIGGEKLDNRDPSKDLRSFSGLGEYFSDSDVQKNGRALMDMVTGVSPAAAALGFGGMGQTPMGPQMPAFGMDPAVSNEIAQAAAGGGAYSGGFDSSQAGSEGEQPGMYAKGGKVGPRGLLAGDPPGPDNVVIGAKTGERILNAQQFASLSKEARAEVERALKAKK